MSAEADHEESYGTVAPMAPNPTNSQGAMGIYFTDTGIGRAFDSVVVRAYKPMCRPPSEPNQQGWGRLRGKDDIKPDSRGQIES